MTPRVMIYAEEAAARHDTTVPMILGPRRRRNEVAARRDVWAHLRADGFSVMQIARWTNRDHTTVLHGLGRCGAHMGCEHR